MTDHKPLSDEELVGLDRPDYYLDPVRRARLVAQSREANRLREENALLKQQAANVLILQPEELKGMCESIVRGNEDPAARAKRELGEWLVEDYHSRKARLQMYGEDRFRMHLHDAAYFHVIGEWCATEAEAITAALRAAKESGR